MLKAGLSEDVVIPIGLVMHLHIIDLRPEGQGEVGGKRPRRGRPRQEVGVFLAVDGKAHGYRLVDHILVSAKVHLKV